MCNCLNYTQPNWEPESLALFKALSDGKFPLNTTVKNAFDNWAKALKAFYAPSIVITGVNSLTITSPDLVGQSIAVISVDNNWITTFAKPGDTDEERLASDTVVLDDIGVDNSTVVILFKKNQTS